LLFLLTALEAEQEKLRCRLGHISDYVEACGSYLVEHLDNIMCRIHDIIDFGIHRGATMALLVGELRFGCVLQDVVGPPSSLSNEGLEDALEGYDEATICVVHRLYVDDVVCSASLTS
jgi:hypothetical protein